MSNRSRFGALFSAFGFGKADVPALPRASVQPSDGGTLIDLSSPEALRQLQQGVETASGAVVGERAALRVAAAWRCIHLIAGVPANMPLDLMERVDETTRRPATHPLRNVLTVRPNHWQTPSEFKRMLTACVALRGNGYAYKVKGALGQVKALWPIHPDRMEPEQAADMSLAYKYQRPNGQIITLQQDEVLHLRGLTLDGIKGLGVLAYARETLGMALRGQQAAANVWRQGAMAGGAFRVPGELSEIAYSRLKTSLEERNSGADNAGKWMILEENADVADLGMTMADMQFLESRQFERSDIAMFFGVPPHMIGDVSKTTSWGDGIASQKEGFVAFTAEDYLTTWEEACRRDLLTEDEAMRLYVRFNRASFVRGDLKARWEAYVKGLQWGVYSPDEVRAMEDLNPRNDGEGGQYYDPPNTAGGPDPSGAQNDPTPPAR